VGVHFDIAPIYEGSLDTVALRKNIQLVMIELNIPETSEFSIAFVDDVTIQELNLSFRGVDFPTDVLSFPVQEVNPENNTQYIGDIVISMDTVEKQSSEQSILPIDEIHLLIVHGILHLLGHDHDNEKNKNKMWALQSELLKILECPANPDRYAI